uniref:ribosomal protein S2 n=1 Tax=Halimeda opuntia TaxID=118223 RepID=UPI002114DF16|nr:ribosomal protein S2 [Halimeda opuntia]UTN43187.1 ribosomal protein S2 [Halimeda opuntia]
MQVKQTVQQMMLAGVHFGHKQKNPKMTPYIYTEKDDLQIIDLLQTYKYLRNASQFLFEACQNGQQILFVGTKKHISKCIEQTATECNSWYINKRWLGGLLTNLNTMQKSISAAATLQPVGLQQYVSASYTAPSEGRQVTEQSHSQNALTKKEVARLERRKKRLQKYLGGVKTMSKLPDIVIIIGQQKEINAVRECQKLKITSLTILDTNCDPSLTDLFIPANDDSLASVNFILNQLSKAIKEGKRKKKEKKYVK